MDRISALKLLESNLFDKNLIKHSLSVEAVMVDLAEHFKEDKEDWGVAGLLHDVDYEQTKDCPEKHGLKSMEILKDAELSQDVLNAIASHNEMTQVSKETLMAKALFCVDPLTGLIVASTLVVPSRKIKDLELASVLKKFKEKSFAKGAKRENILLCEQDLGLKLEDFLKIALLAMQKIDKDLGL